MSTTSSAVKKPRLNAIEYIRGISMMGVIGIHVGSQYVENTFANQQLIALFEVVSRFSVPIFFFISAFGLFYNLDMSRPFSYMDFLRRRFRAVLIPYIVWSLAYVLHDSILFHTGFPDILHLLSLLFFGNAKYHLYFLVILIWFYLAMPLWIPIVMRMTRQALFLLLLAQIAFDYWSSYSVPFNLFVYGLPDTSILKPFLMYRLNYWPFHYIFIFLFGGYLAVHIRAFQEFLQRRTILIPTFFVVTLSAMLLHYYDVIYRDGYTLLEAINTVHQLAPEGILYTAAAALFFFRLFTYVPLSRCTHWIFHELGLHSYFAYLFHPFLITYLALLLHHSGHIMTAPLAIAFYLVTLLLSVCIAGMFRRIGTHLPWVNKLTIGVYPRHS